MAARRIACAARGVRAVDRHAGDRAAELDLAEVELVDARAAPLVHERSGDSLRAGRHAQTKAPARVELDRSAVERDVDPWTVAPHELARRVLPTRDRQEGVDGELVLGEHLPHEPVIPKDVGADASHRLDGAVGAEGVQIADVGLVLEHVKPIESPAGVHVRDRESIAGGLDMQQLGRRRIRLGAAASLEARELHETVADQA